MENVPYSDLAAAVKLNLKVPTYQKRLTKQRLRNTNRERTQHILVLVIPSSRIINHSVAWSRLIKFSFWILKSWKHQWHYLKPGSLSNVQFLLRCHTLRANSPESSKAFNRRVHSSWICQSTFKVHSVMEARVQCMNSTLYTSESLIILGLCGLFENIIHFYRSAWTYIIHAFESFWVLLLLPSISSPNRFAPHHCPTTCVSSTSGAPVAAPQVAINNSWVLKSCHSTAKLLKKSGVFTKSAPSMV